MPTARLCVRAILFDMDNTLLASRIDYAAMRREVGDRLVREGYLAEDEIENGTTASLIQAAIDRGLAGEALDRIWAICARHEAQGMRGAELEPGARETLERLRACGLLLAVLTNNAEAAAERALGETGIRQYFDIVAGRESVPALKPSPAGVRAVLARRPDVPPGRWLAVGDSWIDGAAAAGAGIAFAAYRARHDMAERGIEPVVRINRLDELPDWLEEHLEDQ
jgi:phosphoglycolate phosphatase